MEGMKKQEKYTDDQQQAQIPFFVHEAEMNRMERLNKKWFYAFLVAIIMLFVTNGAWLVYEMQYQDEVYSYELHQDSGEGGENMYTNNRIVIGGDYDGEADSQGDGETSGEEIVGRNKDVP